MNTRFVELAKRAALRSSHKYHVGAVLTRGNKVVSFGTNQPKTHPQSYCFWKTIHAEADALLGVPLSESKGGTMFVVRITRTGLLATSRPCQACFAMLRDYGVKKVYYINDARELVHENIPTLWSGKKVVRKNVRFMRYPCGIMKIIPH
jgi:deoxycytidylate deaminase